MKTHQGELQARVLGQLSMAGASSTPEVARALGDAADKVGVVLRRLHSAQLVRRTDVGRIAIYALSEQGERYRESLLAALCGGFGKTEGPRVNAALPQPAGTAG